MSIVDASVLVKWFADEPQTPQATALTALRRYAILVLTEVSCMVHTYHVEFETDPQTRTIVVSLPTLNYTADFGTTVEEALERLQQLAQGFLDLLAEKGEPIPPSDPPGEGVYLSLKLEHEPLVA